MTPLKRKILDLIRANGPISIAEYMNLALYDPEHGFYMTRDPFGAKGAFTTAPEISQMFGELIGAFFVQAWDDRGRPERFHFVELGPGRGTLMSDMLRAARVRPGFEKAAQVTLVEISPVLKAIQQKTLADHNVRWATSLDEVPDDAPLFLVANEFFDALPIRQYVNAKDGWHERIVSVDVDGLVFQLAPQATLFGLTGELECSIWESSAPAINAAMAIAARVACRRGLAIVLDYGTTPSRFGDTLQAIKAHRKVHPLAEPGEADMTAHVNFDGLHDVAINAGACPIGPVTQKAFLESLGIHARAEKLMRAAPNQADDIRAAVARLTGEDQMGTLFKVLVISDSATPPAGFPA